mmetsp:Transcript_53631/g.123322  ORF Transcript_53631/g.123322 Transcript_53631/m.123322 type:complete len:298 (+) Transcript_53631:592-1485(+)
MHEHVGAGMSPRRPTDVRARRDDHAERLEAALLPQLRVSAHADVPQVRGLARREAVSAAARDAQLLGEAREERRLRRLRREQCRAARPACRLERRVDHRLGRGVDGVEEAGVVHVCLVHPPLRLCEQRALVKRRLAAVGPERELSGDLRGAGVGRRFLHDDASAEREAACLVVGSREHQRRPRGRSEIEHRANRLVIRQDLVQVRGDVSGVRCLVDLGALDEEEEALLASRAREQVYRLLSHLLERGHRRRPVDLPRVVLLGKEAHCRRVGEGAQLMHVGRERHAGERLARLLREET